MPGTNGITQNLILMLVFFHIFIINMDNKAESTFNKPSDETEVEFSD